MSHILQLVIEFVFVLYISGKTRSIKLLIKKLLFQMVSISIFSKNFWIKVQYYFCCGQWKSNHSVQ